MMFCSIQCPTCHRVVYLITGIPSVMRTAFVNTFRFNVRLLSIILSLHNSCRFISIGMLPVPCVARRSSAGPSTRCSTWRPEPAPSAGARITPGARCSSLSVITRPPASSSEACLSWSTMAGVSKTSLSAPTPVRCAPGTSKQCPA